MRFSFVEILNSFPTLNIRDHFTFKFYFQTDRVSNKSGDCVTGIIHFVKKKHGQRTKAEPTIFNQAQEFSFVPDIFACGVIQSDDGSSEMILDVARSLLVRFQTRVEPTQKLF